MSETQRVETQDPDSIGACKLSAPGVGANANAFAIYMTADGCEVGWTKAQLLPAGR